MATTNKRSFFNFSMHSDYVSHTKTTADEAVGESLTFDKLMDPDFDKFDDLDLINHEGRFNSLFGSSNG